ncbi:MAG: T9SS type A sorting domain-containing protein [Bacteroidia bacterium]|nr:T9SS type A sorting domain-containing protein [Bacteroidia bacterium]
MKKFILSLLLCFSLYSFSQVVFCPPGAEWNYYYGPGMAPPTTNMILRVRYVKDTLVDQIDQARLISNVRFFPDGCTTGASNSVIMEKNNKVYFRNQNTNHTWQVLFDFNCTAGQGWATQIFENPTSPSLLTFQVDSVATVVIHGENLKRLYMHTGWTVTERLGSSGFFFPVTEVFDPLCDPSYMFKAFICYKDDDFGAVQISNHTCVAATSVNENIIRSGINIYPIPANNTFNIELPDHIQETVNYVELMNAMGQIVVTQTIGSGSNQINIQNVEPGIYTAIIRTDNRILAVKKFAKD